MIRSKEITPNNWRLGLKIAEAQQTYASNDTKILARAYAYSNHRSKAYVIYNDEIPTGTRDGNEIIMQLDL